MMWNLIIIAFMFNKINASNCQYCMGDSCDNEDIEAIPCERQPRNLPFQLESPTLNFRNQRNVCLQVVYIDGYNRKLSTKQCWIFSNSLCKQIQFDLPFYIRVEECIVRDPNKRYRIIQRLEYSQKATTKPVTLIDLPHNENRSGTEIDTTTEIRSDEVLQKPYGSKKNISYTAKSLSDKSFETDISTSGQSTTPTSDLSTDTTTNTSLQKSETASSSLIVTDTSPQNCQTTLTPFSSTTTNAETTESTTSSSSETISDETTTDVLIDTSIDISLQSTETTISSATASDQTTTSQSSIASETHGLTSTSAQYTDVPHTPTLASSSQPASSSTDVRGQSSTHGPRSTTSDQDSTSASATTSEIPIGTSPHISTFPSTDYSIDPSTQSPTPSIDKGNSIVSVTIALVLVVSLVFVGIIVYLII